MSRNKEGYVTPMLEIVRLAKQDVITLSEGGNLELDTDKDKEDHEKWGPLT